MKNTIKNPMILSLIFLWLGVFLTVSFIETPLKFQVEGMTLPVALGLGKIMFSISTNIQLVIAAIILILLFASNKKINLFELVLLKFSLLLLLAQKFWMLPILDYRADLLAIGKPVPPSELHNIFIGSEIIKLLLLFALVIFQFKFIRLYQPISKFKTITK